MSLSLVSVSHVSQKSRIEGDMNICVFISLYGVYESGYHDGLGAGNSVQIKTLFDLGDLDDYVRNCITSCWEPPSGSDYVKHQQISLC